MFPPISLLFYNSAKALVLSTQSLFKRLTNNAIKITKRQEKNQNVIDFVQY